MKKIFFSLAIFSILSCLLISHSYESELGKTGANSEEKCKTVEIYKIDPASGMRDIFKNQGKIELKNEVWFEVPICGRKFLYIEAEGSSNVSPDAEMVVIQGNKIVFDEKIGYRRKISLPIKNESPMYIGFVNAYNDVEVRQAILYNLNVLGNNGCRGFSEINFATAGSVWSKKESSLALAYEPSPKIIPCSSGKLRFDAFGTMTGGRAPIVEIYQNNLILKRFSTTNSLQSMSLDISADALELKLVNPSDLMKGYRHLLIYSINASYY